MFEILLLACLTFFFSCGGKDFEPPTTHTTEKPAEKPKETIPEEKPPKPVLKTKEFTDSLVKKALEKSGEIFSLVEDPKDTWRQVYDLFMAEDQKPNEFKSDIDDKGLSALINDVILPAVDLGIAQNLFLDFDLWQKTQDKTIKRIFGTGRKLVDEGPLPLQIFLRLSHDPKKEKEVVESYRSFIQAMKKLAKDINIDWPAYAQKSIRLLKRNNKKISEETLRKVFDI